MKNLTVRSGKQKGADQREDRKEEKMDISEGEKSYVNATAQSKYIKQAKNASKVQAEKMALNAIREQLEAEKIRTQHVNENADRSDFFERKERTTTPAKSARRLQQKSANRKSQMFSNAIDDAVEDRLDHQQVRPYVDVSNRPINTQYNTTFSDFRAGNLVDGKRIPRDAKMDTTDTSNTLNDNQEVEMEVVPSESKFIKRKSSSKTVNENKQKQRETPEPIVLTPREPPRTSTYTITLEAPNNPELLENNHSKPNDSPPERKKVGRHCCQFLFLLFQNLLSWAFYNLINSLPHNPDF